MTYSIFFAIVLILVSGFVAYFGDLLGRRMGKKRLTLFGMRPRYTAIVITTITGMVIAGLALTTLVSVNPEFRRMFEEGEKIIKRNKILAITNVQLTKRGKLLSARSEQLQREVALRQKQLEAARMDVQKALRARDAAVKVRDAAVKARDAAIKARNSAALSIARLEKEIAARQVELADLRKRNRTAEKDIKERTAQLESLQTELVSEQAKLHSAQDDLKVALANLTTANANLTDTQEQLTQAKKAVDEQNEVLRLQHQSIVAMGKQNLQSQKETYELRSSKLILRQGDELARGVLSSGTTAFGLRADLSRLLEQAGDKAETYGAAKGDNGRAVKVIFRQMVDPEHNLGVVIDDESRCITLAINKILSQYDDALVRVVCADNTIAGEQAPVEFRLYINDLVFRNGRLIATTRLDGTLSEGRLLLAVINFLRKDVSQAALRSVPAIIPVTNPDPNESLTKDSADQVEALMALVDQIKTANGRVKVEVFAAEDIYAAGPLSMDNMRFKVTKLE